MESSLAGYNGVPRAFADERDQVSISFLFIDRRKTTAAIHARVDPLIGGRDKEIRSRNLPFNYFPEISSTHGVKLQEK